MRNPFIARRPWAAFFLSLVLTPIAGMLYFGKPQLAGWYLLVAIFLMGAFFAVYPTGFGDLSAVEASTFVNWAFRLVGAGHAAYMASKHPFVSPGRWFSRWYTVLGVPIAYVVIVLVNQHALFPIYYMPSPAMEPTIGVNDAVSASRLAYHFRAPDRGDVIAFYDPPRRATFIKRIIGLPHDRIQIRGGIVMLNGKPMPHTVLSYMDYLQQERLLGRSYTIRKNTMSGDLLDDVPEVTVPAGRYYVLGDNRDNSLDSRSTEVGFIARTDIVGPVTIRFFDDEERHFVWRPVH